MGGEHFTVLIHGFKYSRHLLQTFLYANGTNIQVCDFINEEGVASIDKLFRYYGVDGKVRVFTPSSYGGESEFVYICFDWVRVVAVRGIDDVLKTPMPAGFEKLLEILPKMIGPEARIQKYVLNSRTIAIELGDVEAEELARMSALPIGCGLCDAVFDDWEDRYTHHEDEHLVEHCSLSPIPLPQV